MDDVRCRQSQGDAPTLGHRDTTRNEHELTRTVMLPAESTVVLRFCSANSPDRCKDLGSIRSTLLGGFIPVVKAVNTTMPRIAAMSTPTPSAHSDSVPRIRRSLASVDHGDLAERMKASLGQPVIVENVTGAGGSIGVGRVARASPDAYTLSLGPSPPRRLHNHGKPLDQQRRALAQPRRGGARSRGTDA
jgi:Tripartite tricarboxylate transporter family receptor